MKSSMTKLIFTALLLVFAWLDGSTQGWRRTYDVDTNIIQEQARKVFQTSDGGYLLIGDLMVRTDAEGDTIWTKPYPLFQINYLFGNNMAALLSDGSFVVSGFVGGSADAYLSKFAANGDLIWQKTYNYNATASIAEASGITITSDGGFAVLINMYINLQPKLAILKTDASGNQLWTSLLTGAEVEAGHCITSLSDGGFAIAARRSNGSNWNPYVVKTDASGDIEWDTVYNMPNAGYAASIVESSDHHIMVMGHNAPLQNGLEQVVFVKKLGLSGNEIWSTNNGQYDLNEPGQIIETSDSHFVICGQLIEDLNAFGNRQGFLWNIDEDGSTTWHRIFDQDYNSFEFFRSVEQTPEGGYIIGGSQFDQPQTYFDHLLLKTDALGFDYSHHLFGSVFRDDNLGCDPDPNEPGLEGWLVTATDGNQFFYANTDALGNYHILLDTGIYEVGVTPYLYWENCQPSYTVQALQTYDTTDLAIPLKPASLCPYMQVDMAPLQWLTLCNENSYSVSYCNFGTVEAVDATVQVTLDENLSYISATVPLLSQQGQVLTFDIGTVGIGDCGSFNIDFSTSCDPEIFNSTLCSEAHIFPDSICIENFWLGPNLRIEAGCDGDSVLFKIINEGGPMTEPAQYIVIEDNLIMMTSDFQLTAGGESEVRVSAQSESTYHLVALQPPGFPGELGYPVATASAEGCMGNVNPGAFLQLSPDDGEPWLDITCGTVSDFNYPSVALIAMPTGWQSQHFITNNTVIQYRIQFQNTSAGTVQDVVVWDSIPAPLDPASIVTGASSHPFNFELLGQGMAKFTFNDINLPDSISNEPGSHGFVEFQISQMPGNQPGTLIDNVALVQLDLGNPVQSNGVFHTIQDQWLSLVNGTVETTNGEIRVTVTPNPMSAWATIELDKLPSGENMLFLTDAMGRKVLLMPFSEGKVQLKREQMAAGLYFFTVENYGQVIGSGKVVVR